MVGTKLGLFSHNLAFVTSDYYNDSQHSFGVCIGDGGVDGDQASIPVFPEVGSMSVAPGFSLPSFSASSTIRSAIRSFTLPPALKYSHLASGNNA